MSIQSILKSTAVALAIVTAGPVFAQGTPIDAAAFDALIAQGPVADAGTIASSTWASKIKQAGTLRLGADANSEPVLAAQRERHGKIRGFDAGLAQLITRYILGDGAGYKFTQVTSSTREQVLINDQVDMVFATYSITPARAEKIAFAGPYYLAGRGAGEGEQQRDPVAQRSGRQEGGHAGGPRGQRSWRSTAPQAAVQEFQTHQEALDALRQGRVDAYVTDYTLLLNALSLGTGDARLAGAPFGAQDPYGVGLPKGSDGVAFVNAFLKKIEADGTWAKLWTISIGQRTGSTAVPTPPALP